jgi:phosphoglycolate phosphatase
MNGVKQDGEVIDPSGPLAAGTFEQEKIVLATAFYLIEHIPWDEAIQQAHLLMLDADRKMKLESYLQPLPGFPEKILELSRLGIPICILTSDIRARAMEMLHHFRLNEEIKLVVTPEDIAEGKPAPDMVHHAAKALSVDPASMVIVGDSPLDIQMAKSAGALAVAVTINTYEDQFEKADAVIHSIQDITVNRYVDPTHK